MSDKEKIKVIIWKQCGSKIVQKAENVVEHIQAMIEDDNFSCWVEDKEEIKLTAAFMTEEELENLPDFQGF